jgi:hypothetical protein
MTVAIRLRQATSISTPAADESVDSFHRLFGFGGLRHRSTMADGSNA